MLTYMTKNDQLTESRHCRRGESTLSRREVGGDGGGWHPGWVGVRLLVKVFHQLGIGA